MPSYPQAFTHPQPSPVPACSRPPCPRVTLAPCLTATVRTAPPSAASPSSSVSFQSSYPPRFSPSVVSSVICAMLFRSHQNLRQLISKTWSTQAATSPTTKRTISSNRPQPYHLRRRLLQSLSSFVWWSRRRPSSTPSPLKRIRLPARRRPASSSPSRNLPLALWMSVSASRTRAGLRRSVISSQFRHG